jgi:hypothetical protein
MGVLRFSPALLSGSTASLQGYMLNLGNAAIGPGWPAIPGINAYVTPLLPFFMAGYSNYGRESTNCAVVRVMSGPIPTNIETLTSAEPPPAGTTVLWQLGTNGDASQWAPTQNNWYTDPTSISSIFTPVSATGIANWFWISTVQWGLNRAFSGNPYFIYNPAVHNIIGTVGLVGSGSDMEMLNTSLVSGQFLRVLNLRFRIPVAFY